MANLSSDKWTLTDEEADELRRANPARAMPQLNTLTSDEEACLDDHREYVCTNCWNMWMLAGTMIGVMCLTGLLLWYVRHKAKKRREKAMQTIRTRPDRLSPVVQNYINPNVVTGVPIQPQMQAPTPVAMFM